MMAQKSRLNMMVRIACTTSSDSFKKAKSMSIDFSIDFSRAPVACSAAC
jgi:hypothetical protein